MWTNYVVENAAVAKVRTIADCGIFLDAVSYTTSIYAFKEQFTNLMNISNS